MFTPLAFTARALIITVALATGVATQVHNSVSQAVSADPFATGITAGGAFGVVWGLMRIIDKLVSGRRVSDESLYLAQQLEAIRTVVTGIAHTQDRVTTACEILAETNKRIEVALRNGHVTHACDRATGADSGQ